MRKWAITLKLTQDTIILEKKMTKDNFLMPDYYNTSKTNKEENLVDRKCYMCGVKTKMGKFERYCSVHCRNRATHMDINAHGIKFK